MPFPRYSVALLQSESEMLQVPEHDLLPALERDEAWDVELFTERTVHALLNSADRFDCVVVGYNAAYKSEEIRAALAAQALGVGMLVLHQLEAPALSFLSEPLAGATLRPPADHAIVPREVEPHDEILLNWPERVALDGGRLPHATAYVGLAPQVGSNWRTVLETRHGQRRVPLLVRTDARSSAPLAVSAVLLAPRHAAHLALLKNLLMWCAAGRPAAVVIESPDAPDAAIIHRKLRLQGVGAVRASVASREQLDFRQWPLWGARDALLPEWWDPTRVEGWPAEDPHNVKPWLRRGHRIVLLGPGDSLTVRHGESDAHWVARRWAVWFNSVPGAAWHGGTVGEDPYSGSIVAARSILRMLSALHGAGRGTTLPGLATAHAVLDRLSQAGTGIDAAGLGLPEPERFAEPVARLLRRRVGADHSVEGTISTTVAALDVDAMLANRALGRLRAPMVGWLRARFAHAALEDRLEIARCLGDAALLDEVLRGAADDVRVGQPLSAVMLSSLRSALVACGAQADTPLDWLPLDPEYTVVDRELRMRPMLAAGYLIGVLDLQRAWSSAPQQAAAALRDPPVQRVDSAAITLGRYGPLSRGRTGWKAPVPELASTEALALIAYFARYPVPTHVVAGSDVAADTLGSLLREGERSRRETERLDQKVEAFIERDRRAARALALYGEALILAVVGLFAITVAPHLGSTWDAPSSFGLWGLLTLALLALLGRYRLPVPGAARIAPWLADGWKAVRGDLARSVASGSRPRDQ